MIRQSDPKANTTLETGNAGDTAREVEEAHCTVEVIDNRRIPINEEMEDSWENWESAMHSENENAAQLNATITCNDDEPSIEQVVTYLVEKQKVRRLRRLRDKQATMHRFLATEQVECEDTCMQLIADPRYMKTDDKQKAVIRSPISVGMTWESETTNIITSLCAVLVQDMINLSTFKWTHPDGFTVTFTNKYFVADNKATSMAIGNQTGGHYRCKHCKINFDKMSDLTDYCKCMEVADRQIDFSAILERAKKGANHCEKGTGLVNVSGFFSEYCTGRKHIVIPECHRQFFNSLTPQVLGASVALGKQQLATTAIQKYRQDNKSLDISVDETEITCIMNEVEHKLELATVISKLSEVDNDERLLDVLYILVYIHCNRANLTLKDFGMDNLILFSDAPHAIAGLNDRLYNLFCMEQGGNKVMVADRTFELLGLARSDMNHSDKRESILRSFEIYFGQKQIETGPVDTNTTQAPQPSEAFQKALEEHNTRSQMDIDDEYVLEIVSKTIDIPATITEVSQSNSLFHTSDEDDVIMSESTPERINPSQQSSDANQSTSTNPQFAVQESVGNLMWILLLMQWLIRLCSMSEEKRTKKEQNRFHMVTFLLFVLCTDRYGAKIMTNYLHDIGIHMPNLFEKIAFAAVNGDMFEECFAELKVFMRTSCHRKLEAEIACFIKRNKMDHYYMIHPSQKRRKSNSRIKKLLDEMQICKILLTQTYLNSKYKDMIDAKISQMKKDPEYADMFVQVGSGILLNFTGDIGSPVYLPSRPMLVEKDITIAGKMCKRHGCDSVAKSKLCDYCADCCIGYFECRPEGKLCSPHLKTNKERDAANRSIAAGKSEFTEGSVPMKNGKGTPKIRRIKTVSTKALSEQVPSRSNNKRTFAQTQDQTADNIADASPSKRSKNNGSKGACTCSSTCQYNTCPCAEAGVQCSEKCHMGKRGSVATKCVN